MIETACIDAADLRTFRQIEAEMPAFPYTYCMARRNFFGGKQLRVE